MGGGTWDPKSGSFQDPQMPRKVNRHVGRMRHTAPNPRRGQWQSSPVLGKDRGPGLGNVGHPLAQVQGEKGDGAYNIAGNNTYDATYKRRFHNSASAGKVEVNRSHVPTAREITKRVSLPRGFIESVLKLREESQRRFESKKSAFGDRPLHYVST